MTHKIFLTWLIYLIAVILITAGLCFVGIPQIAIMSDSSYLTIVLLGMYVISEGLSARQAWRMSKEHLVATRVTKWLQANKLTSLTVDDSQVTLVSNDVTYPVPKSETANHISALYDMAADGNHVNQNILLDVLAEHLHGSISIIEFVAGRVVWVGILATILGVILAFWPLLSAGMALEAIRLKLGGFFAGIAVAFIPTAASFVFKIALDFGTKILTNGATEIITIIARTSETKILPVLERNVRENLAVASNANVSAPSVVVNDSNVEWTANNPK